MSENETVGSFNWVHAQSECSLERVFQILSEIIDSDVKAANALKRSGVKFSTNTQAGGKTLVIRDRDIGGLNELSIIVIELRPNNITVSQRVPSKVVDQLLFSATPGLNDEGECWLEVDEKQLKLWQVSRKALKGLFFDF